MDYDETSPSEKESIRERLAILRERVNVVIKTTEEEKNSSRDFRAATEKKLEEVKDTQQKLIQKTDQHGEKFGLLETQILEIRVDLSKKLSTYGFNVLWKIMIGIGVLLGILSSLVSVLVNLQHLH